METKQSRPCARATFSLLHVFLAVIKKKKMSFLLHLFNWSHLNQEKITHFAL